MTMAGVVPELEPRQAMAVSLLQKQERQARHQLCLALIEGLD